MWKKQDSADPANVSIEQQHSELVAGADPSTEVAANQNGDQASRQLAALEHAQRVLAEVSTFEDIKGIRDKAEAVRRYAASAELGLALQNKAAELMTCC